MNASLNAPSAPVPPESGEALGAPLTDTAKVGCGSGAAPCSVWRRFWFESNQFFGWIENMDDWQRLRQAYPEKTDAVLLAAKEATYKGNLSQQERDARPNFGLRWEHDGERTLRDFFAENGMRLGSGTPQ